ncbi:MAG TPA: outer membrane beta-barrel protein, partial [Gemmatimonadales bacterium]
AGAFVRLGALGFAVQPGAYYTVKGAKTSDFSDVIGSKTAIDYLEIPLVLRIGLPMHLYVGAGPAIGFKLGCTFTDQTADATVSEDCKDAVNAPDLKSTEITGIAEAGFEFRHWSLGARADLGLSNVQEAVSGGSGSDISVKTRTISAVLAIRF